MAIVGKGTACMLLQKDSTPFSTTAKPSARLANPSTNLRSTPEEKDFLPAPRSTRAPMSLRTFSAEAAAARPSATPASIAFMREALSKVTTATAPRISVLTLPTLLARDRGGSDESEAQAVELGRVLEIDAVPGLRDHVQRGVRQHAFQEVARLAAARVLVADHDQHRQEQRGEALRVHVERRARALHPALGVGVADRRHRQQLLVEAAELRRVLVLQAPSRRALVHLRG